MAKLQNEDVVLAQTSAEGITVQLVDRRERGCFLRRIGPGGAVIAQSPPLHSDSASLLEARELFPEHLPWAGMAVDGNF